MSIPSYEERVAQAQQQRAEYQANWRQHRDGALEELAEAASALLVDRTVVHVAAVPHEDECDSANVLRLTLDDGSVVDIEGGYGGYTGRSCDEYVETIDVRAMPR